MSLMRSIEESMLQLLMSSIVSASSRKSARNIIRYNRKLNALFGLCYRPEKEGMMLTAIRNLILIFM